MSDVTFFAWGDMHFGYNQKDFAADLRGKIIDQMNELPGIPFPGHMGGTVKEPDFVVACGDMVDGEPEADEEYEWSTYKQFCDKLRYKQYEVLGNHDTGKLFTKYFVDKYQGKSYSFDHKGIHFISLNSDYDTYEVGHVSDADLKWLGDDLSKIVPDMEVVIFVHTRIDSLKNTDQLLDILKNNNIILIVSAHKHKPDVFQCGGITCIGIGHCRNHKIDLESARSFYVISILDESIVAIPWRWDMMTWDTNLQVQYHHAREQRRES